jgi:hypothetical protein
MNKALEGTTTRRWAGQVPWLPSASIMRSFQMEGRREYETYDDTRPSTFRGISVGLSDEHADAPDSSQVNRAFDSNEVDDRNPSDEKHDDPWEAKCNCSKRTDMVTFFREHQIKSVGMVLFWIFPE